MINDASFAYIIANYYAHLAAIGQASQVDPHDVAHAASAAMVVWRHLRNSLPAKTSPLR